MPVKTAAEILSNDTRVRAKGRHHQEVDSTNIEHWEYRAATLELTVKFLSGPTYVYRRVPPQTWAALRKADSAGDAFARLVRDKYPFTKKD